MTDTPTLSAEQRTAKFQARISQKRLSPLERAKEYVSGLAKGQNRGRRIIALAAAIAVPAVAADGDWQTFSSAAPEIGLIDTASAMPFERPGESFPGSAFYFLEDAPRADYGNDSVGQADFALFDTTGTGATETAELAIAEIAGPSARAFFSAGSGLSKGRALECMTKAIYYEAASEATGGQRAVAQVVLNRVAHPSYPNSVCGVVFQGSERRTGCQFSFTCDGSLKRVPSRNAWARAQQIAQDSLSGTVYSPVGLATHYHTIWIHPYWAPSLDPIGTIGAHRFYKWKGNAGKPAAFRSAYSGNEPSVTARANAGLADAVTSTRDSADPIALARAYEEGRLKALADAKANAPRAPAPKYSAGIEERGGDAIFTPNKLPESGGVKEEYANSGRWINEPKQAEIQR